MKLAKSEPALFDVTLSGAVNGPGRLTKIGPGALGINGIAETHLVIVEGTLTGTGSVWSTLTMLNWSQ